MIGAVKARVARLALILGWIGMLSLILLLPLAIFSRTFWTGFSQDGPGMAETEREAAVSEALQSDLLYRFAPPFLSSLALLSYGYYNTAKSGERKRAALRFDDSP
jgi:hypothetical protein